MFEVIDVLNALGTPLKLAWIVWLAWGVGQYFWLRKRRSMPAKRVTSVAKPAPKKVAVPKTVAAQAAEAPVVGRLITPSHVTADPKPSAPVMPAVQPEPVAVSAPMPMAVAATTAEAAPAPTFDPSKPVAEPAPMPMVAATAEAGQPPAVDPSRAVTFDPSKAVAAFDPSNAVIEQFGAMSDDVLDKFVRDFEMQDARPRRRKTTPLSETPSYGAEAPQVP